MCQESLRAIPSVNSEDIVRSFKLAQKDKNRQTKQIPSRCSSQSRAGQRQESRTETGASLYIVFHEGRTCQHESTAQGDLSLLLISDPLC